MPPKREAAEMRRLTSEIDTQKDQSVFVGNELMGNGHPDFFILQGDLFMKKSHCLEHEEAMKVVNGCSAPIAVKLLDIEDESYVTRFHNIFSEAICDVLMSG